MLTKYFTKKQKNSYKVGWHNMNEKKLILNFEKLNHSIYVRVFFVKYFVIKPSISHNKKMKIKIMGLKLN